MGKMGKGAICEGTGKARIRAISSLRMGISLSDSLYAFDYLLTEPYDGM